MAERAGVTYLAPRPRPRRHDGCTPLLDFQFLDVEGMSEHAGRARRDGAADGPTIPCRRAVMRPRGATGAQRAPGAGTPLHRRRAGWWAEWSARRAPFRRAGHVAVAPAGRRAYRPARWVGALHERTTET